MAFIFGTGLNLADRWHNQQEWTSLILGGSPFNVAAGNIQMAIDRSQCASFLFNNLPMFTPCIVSDALGGNITGSGATDGLGEPTTTLEIFSDDTDPNFFSYNFWWMYFHADGIVRNREIHLSNFNIRGWTGGPDPTVFKTRFSPGVSRLTNSHLIKHVGINDLTPVPVGDKNIFENIKVLEQSRFPTFLETSSGAYSLFQFDSCDLRGNTECLHIFGAGANEAQQMGKRCFLNDSRLMSVYDQPPGPEIASLGGNGIYIHPVVQLRWIGGEAGTAGGGTAEWIPERPIYFNGSTTGIAPDHLIDGVTLHPNAYQGLKFQAGRKANGQQGFIEIRNSNLLSYFKAADNDDANVWIHDCTIGGGSVISALPGSTKLGAGMLVENCSLALSYAQPPPEYRGGSTHIPSDGGNALFRFCDFTISAAIFGPNVSSFSTLTVEDCTVTVIGSAAAGLAAFLCATNGNIVLRRNRVTGQIRPTYFNDPLSAIVEDHNDFSGATVAPRLLKVDQNKSTVDSTTLWPANLALTIDVDTQSQEWSLYHAVGAPIASAATINVSPNADQYSVTGNAVIANINILAAASNRIYHGALLALFGSGWSTSAAGNILPLITTPRTDGGTFRYDATQTKWVEFVPGFSGEAQVRQVSDRLFLIKGLFMFPTASGTIGPAGDVVLNIASTWSGHGSLLDAVICTVTQVGNATLSPVVSIVKSGTTPENFSIELSNQGSESTSELEIRIRLLN